MVARECRVVLLGQRLPLVAVLSPARARRGRPIAARGWLQPRKFSFESLDVPSCLLRIYRVVGARSRWSLVVLCFRGSLRLIIERVCSSVCFVGHAACSAGHLGTCFVLRLLAAAAARRGAAGASETCAPRARHWRFLRLRGCGHALLDRSVGQFPRVRDSLRPILLYRADQRALTLVALHDSCTRDSVCARLVDYSNRCSRLAGG